MTPINENPLRKGNFTSSKIAKLTTNGKQSGTLGKPAITYIEEKNMERRLGRSLNSELSAKPTTWGTMCEIKVFSLMGTEYQSNSSLTIVHPTIPFWSGSPDGNKFDEGKTVVDFKCPFTLKSFCQLVQPLYKGLSDMDAMNAIRESHDSGDDYYWQLVSNAILTNSKYGELIVYVPYRSELESIREICQNFDGDQNPIAWINFAGDESLPYLNDGGYYKNVNIIRFEIPEADKIFLTERVKICGQMLIPAPGEQAEMNYNNLK